MTSDIIDLDDQTVGSGAGESSRTENADGSVTIALLYPFALKFRQNGIERDEEISELKIRRATGADLRLMLRHQKDEEKLLITLFSRLTGLAEAAFDKLDIEDFARFQEEVQHFLELPQLTGKK